MARRLDWGGGRLRNVTTLPKYLFSEVLPKLERRALRDGEDVDAGTDPLDDDSDDDGLLDGEDGLGDSDGDGIIDALDDDEDNDLISSRDEG